MAGARKFWNKTLAGWRKNLFTYLASQCWLMASWQRTYLILSVWLAAVELPQRHSVRPAGRLFAESVQMN